MKLHHYLIIAAALVALPGCEKQANVNKTDGVKDALDTRPNEGIRDAAEDVEKGIKDAGHDIKESVDGK